MIEQICLKQNTIILFLLLRYELLKPYLLCANISISTMKNDRYPQVSSADQFEQILSAQSVYYGEYGT